MKKIFAGLLLAAMLLSGCGDKGPYADTIKKYVVNSTTGQAIPEEKREFAGAMMEQAWRDFESEGIEVKEFKYAWDYQDASDNILGLGHISLEIIPDGAPTKQYSYLFTE